MRFDYQILLKSPLRPSNFTGWIRPWSRGVQPCSTAGPNAHNQIGPRATATCVTFSGLDNSLATCASLAMPL